MSASAGNGILSAVMASPRSLPVPDLTRSTLVVPAPGDGPGYWAGGPSAVAVRRGRSGWPTASADPWAEGRGYANVIARSDGRRAPSRRSPSSRPGSLRRRLPRAPGPGPAARWGLAPLRQLRHARAPCTGRSTPSTPTSRAASTRQRAHHSLPGDEVTAHKDPVVHAGPDGWRAWLCCHALDDPSEADGMYTRFATSPDGLDWTLDGTALAPRPGAWDCPRRPRRRRPGP